MLPPTRREFTKLALMALPAASFLASFNSSRAADAPAKPAGKPNSKVAGVQIGLNVPYSFSNPAMSGDDVLKACVQLGVSAVELRAQPVEAFLGVPGNLVNARRAAATGEAGAKAAPADPAAAKANAAALSQWRAAVSMDQVKAFRKNYEEAGVLIEILKVDAIYAMTDAELDYYFAMAKALGARAISCEISTKDADLKRLGSFADQHQLMVGYHGHTAVTPAIWENAFSFAKYNGANVDLGHFVAGNNYSPVEFIKRYHERITHVHIKDKKLHLGPNTPFGQGDTPIVEVLRLIRDNRWPMQATIEFEYKVPADSDRMTEIAKCVKYCRDALTT
jgi:sugar phosphate isomerase/epimerase